MALQRLEVMEPYMGISPGNRFELASATRLASDITLDRLPRRRSLVPQMEQTPRRTESTAERGMDRYQQMAYELIGSTRTQRALDLERQPRALRES